MRKNRGPMGPFCFHYVSASILTRRRRDIRSLRTGGQAMMYTRERSFSSRIAKRLGVSKTIVRDVLIVGSGALGLIVAIIVVLN